MNAGPEGAYMGRSCVAIDRRVGLKLPPPLPPPAALFAGAASQRWQPRSFGRPLSAHMRSVPGSASQKQVSSCAAVFPLAAACRFLQVPARRDLPLSLSSEAVVTWGTPTNVRFRCSV